MDTTLQQGLAFDSEKFIGTALDPDGQTKPREQINVNNIIGRRDSLTEIQQKILTAAISLLLSSKENEQMPIVCSMTVQTFLELIDNQDKSYDFLVSELEKISGKGVWLYEKDRQGLIRTQWFQAIEYTNQKIIFEFTKRILRLIAAINAADIERQLIKEIQFRGKHTLAVFDIIRTAKQGTVTDISIPALMKKLSLEHTRYSYGQLRLRVLEPSLQEIYDWDKDIFVRFGPNFNGRRVEGIWFEVITGKTAQKLREKEPKFRFALPEEKPAK